MCPRAGPCHMSDRLDDSAATTTRQVRGWPAAGQHRRLASGFATRRELLHDGSKRVMSGMSLHRLPYLRAPVDGLSTDRGRRLRGQRVEPV